jgi:hypothetical protein
VTPYSATSTTLTYASGWTDIFDITGENTGCPVTSCELRDATCTDTIPAINANFYIATSDPWGLTAKKDTVAGWAA